MKTISNKKKWRNDRRRQRIRGRDRGISHSQVLNGVNAALSWFTEAGTSEPCFPLTRVLQGAQKYLSGTRHEMDFMEP